MAKLKWDALGERLYETGISNAVLYLLDDDKAYTKGVAWNGVTGVDENPSGAEATKLWADNMNYVTLYSTETFGFTIKAYMYPDEFEACDGTASPMKGLTFGQQDRATFGFCYKTKVGNDSDGDTYGYKLHLVYGCKASPSSKSYATVNDSPDAIEFSWEVNTTPVNVSDIVIGDKTMSFKPVSTIVIDSLDVNPTKLAALEALLYGTDGEGSGTGTTACLPSPEVVYSTLKA